MKPLLSYMLLVVSCSAVFYGYYHFFLRNKKFHQYNRYYLLTITMLSLILPVVHIPVYFNSQQDFPAVYKLLSEVKLANTPHLKTDSFVLSLELILITLYSLAACILFIRFCIALFKIRDIIRKYPGEKINDILFINTQEEGTPCSFFCYMLWNKNISLESAGGQHIFRHELFHIRQKHSIDLLFFELLTITCWINPFFYLIKKEIKAIHEFLADRYAAGPDSKWKYAETLLMQAFQTNQPLVIPFFHNQIKRRIAMITNNQNTRNQYLHKLLVIPICLLLVSLISVTCRTENDMKSPEKITVTEIRKNATGQQSLIEKPIDHHNPAVNKVTVEEFIKKPEIDPAFPGGDEGWRTYLTTNLNVTVPVDKGCPEGAYTVYVQFIVDEIGNTRDIKALTNHGYGMEKEVIRIIANGPKWLPALHHGKKIKAFRKQPVTFQITEA